MIRLDPDMGIINVSDYHTLHLGRVPQGNDVVLSHPAVSAHHARLAMHSDNVWWVEDLESDHGVFVNLQRVGPEGSPIRLISDTLWISPFALRLSSVDRTRQPKPAHFRLDVVNLKRQVDSRILLDLQGTPLSFRPGEFVAIVGGSGAGKSTLLKGLLGMDTIPGKGRSGDIYFNNLLLIHGEDTHLFDPLNTIVGYVPQQDDSIHFQLSAREALDYSAKLRFASDLAQQERTDRVCTTLERVRLGEEELQNKPIHQLSGGQRKRVNVAMELVADPRLLFLDEPTTGLDPGLDLEMMELLQDWAQGKETSDPKTIVLITHATENVRLCDQILFLGGIRIDGVERGGCALYFGPPGDPTREFFGRDTFSEIYLEVANPADAGGFHTKLTHETRWKSLLWQRSRTAEDIKETKALEASRGDTFGRQHRSHLRLVRRQLSILAKRYWLVLRRDTGAFLFQLFQGILVALLLWAVAAQDSLSAAGVRAAPTTLFILGIAATWLGTLNATKEIVRERRIYGRERRYGVSPTSYVLSKVVVLGGLGLWQMAGLIILTVLRFSPESHTGAIGRALPVDIQMPGFLEVEWFITLELLLLAGIALGLCISAFSRSLDQATLMMFPAMLIQVLLAGLLFDVGPLAWFAFTHWGLQALGNSLDLEALFALAGKASDPILNEVNLAGNALILIGYWVILLLFIVGLITITIWRQGRGDKARIPED